MSASLWIGARCSATKGRINGQTFRATGITVSLEAGGTLENAQATAAHESLKTTKLSDRTDDAITLDEVERITIKRPGVESSRDGFHHIKREDGRGQ